MRGTEAILKRCGARSPARVGCCALALLLLLPMRASAFGRLGGQKQSGRSQQHAPSGGGGRNHPQGGAKAHPAAPSPAGGSPGASAAAPSAAPQAAGQAASQSAQAGHSPVSNAEGQPPNGGRVGEVGGGVGGGQSAGLGAGQRQEHLPAWISRHQNLTPEEQQKALAAEPGFSQLPPQTQQRMQERLRQLNAMNPAQRQRVLSRVETMERMTPQQRGQVTAATRQWGALPEDRRRMVGKAFRDLREMPAEQRMAILNSERFRSQFSDQERGVLHSLLNVEPYLPPPGGDGVQYGGK